MLHAPVNDNQTKDKQNKTQSEPESESQNRALGWAGYSSLGLGSEKLSQQGKERAQGWRSISLSSLSQGGILQRRCACGNSGTCSECQSKQGEMLQTKLRISEPGDKYEQEADRIADEVMQMTEPPVQRLPDLQIIQTKSEGGADVSDTLSSRITALQGNGRRMDSTTKSFMERFFWCKNPY
jgi:hypothetical protein